MKWHIHQLITCYRNKGIPLFPWFASYEGGRETQPRDFYAALNWDLTSRVTSCQEWPVRPYCLFTATNFTGLNADFRKSLSFPPSQAGFDGVVTEAKKKIMAMKGRGKMENISDQTFDILQNLDLVMLLHTWNMSPCSLCLYGWTVSKVG